MTLKKILIPLLSLFVLNACASKSSDRYREGDNKGQKVDLTVAQERELTKEALAEMKKDFPQVKSQELQAYIEKLGHKIVNANNLKSKPYTYNFTAVDSDQINAFALPAGEIFITAPIIAMADSEAEIAGVLGHEIGHVVARHTAERMYIAKKEQSKMYVLGGIGAAVGAGLGYLAQKKLCASDDLACKAKLMGGGAAVGGVGGLMIHKYGYMKNSQEDELESDRVGFRYAVNSGYDKNYVGDFYRKLAAMEKESKKGQNAALGFLSDAMSSHPASDKRVSQADEMKSLIKNNGTIKSSSEFARMKRIAQEIVEARRKSSAKK